MAHEFYTTGVVDNSGKLRMPMADVNDFFQKHKGDRIVAKFMAYPKETSDALKGYYYNYVVPTIRQALRDVGDAKTDKETDEYLREVCPLCVCQTHTEDGWASKSIELDEMGNEQIIEFIEWLKMWSAENLSVYIEEPKIL